MATAGELFGGFWDGAYASPVVDAYASAWSALAGPPAGATGGPAPVAWTVRRAEAVSPGPDGRPTTGYPAPATDFDPAWVAFGSSLLAAGADFTVVGGYVWFEVDPLLTAPGYLVWGGDGPTTAADLWAGTYAPPAAGEPPPAATAYAVAVALAAACDSPATGPVPETVEAVWADADGRYRVVTDAAAYRLPAGDSPAVAAGDVLPAGVPLGTAWVLTRLGPAEPAVDRVALPADFHQGVTAGPTVWYATTAPLVVDTVDGRTRVRWRIGGDPADVDAVWAASHARGTAAGATSLAQAMDVRAAPVGDPGPESLPTVVSPMGFLCRELLAGCAYQLVVRPARFGPAAVAAAARTAAVRAAAGPYTAVFEWTDAVPELAEVDPA